MTSCTIFPAAVWHTCRPEYDVLTGVFRDYADVSTSCMLPNIQEPLDKWSSLTSFDNIQSYSASMQMYVPLAFYVFRL